MFLLMKAHQREMGHYFEGFKYILQIQIMKILPALHMTNSEEVKGHGSTELSGCGYMLLTLWLEAAEC